MSARLLLSRTAPRLASTTATAGRAAAAPPSTKAMATRHFSSYSSSYSCSASASSTTTKTATLRRVSSTGAALTLALGATSAVSPFARTRYHFDAFAAAPPAAQGQERAFSSGGGKQGGLDPDLVSQLSKGSITGFLAGLLLSVFSKTLVLLGGVAVVLTQVAAKYGIDIVHQLKLKQRIGNSKVLSALERDPAFKLSFGFFFAMSAFIGF